MFQPTSSPDYNVSRSNDNRKHVTIRTAVHQSDFCKLTDAHLEGTLRLASTHLQPDIQGLVKQAQHQTAHWIENKIKRYI